MFFDGSESAGWLNDVQPEIIAGNKQFLIQSALGDPEVTPTGSEILARAYGCNTVKPQTRPIFNVEEREAPFYGSGIVEFKYGDVPDDPQFSPPRGENPHECPRRQPEAQLQMALFFTSGRVVQTCNDICEKPSCSY